MNQKLKEAYENVSPGWWALLDKYLPQIWAFDPDCVLSIKEKYGTLRIWPHKIRDGISWKELRRICTEAEEESRTVCEICGDPGHLRTDQDWWETLCDRCAAAGRKSTGVRVNNGEIHEGDLVRYEDGWLCFTARIVLQQGVFGFYLDDTFQDLNAFLQDFPGAELDFEIMKER